MAPRRGGRGVYINHEASRTSNDCYVCEIPAGGELAPQRQLYEEMIYILDGTRIDHGVERRRRADHLRMGGKGSMFAIPLNCSGTSISMASGRAPARYVAVTNSPGISSSLRGPGLRLQHRCMTSRRASTASPTKLRPTAGFRRGCCSETNFVADAINLPLRSAPRSAAPAAGISASTSPRAR